MRHFLVFLIITFSFGSSAAWGFYSFWLLVDYDQEIGGHLKRAADASTVELAKQELDAALAGMEERGFTEGYTSMVYKTPDEDVGFWYANIKSSRENLEKLPPDADQLTISNELMKLRETLLDHDNAGENITDPEGITWYPNNRLFTAWGWLSAIALAASVGYLVSSSDRDPRDHQY